MSRSLTPSILFVDGYNIIGAWPCLTKTRDHSGLEASRGELVEAMITYSSFQGYETQIVFDAQYHNSSSNKQTVTELLTVHYTDFGQTADTYIEKTCASLRQQIALALISRVIVATSDRAQQLTVQGYGAEWLSAKQLCGEVKATINQMRYKYQPRQPSKSRFLANALDPKSRQRLSELRMGL
jgi:predicted RNA-binding protein with PIN domain